MSCAQPLAPSRAKVFTRPHHLMIAAGAVAALRLCVAAPVWAQDATQPEAWVDDIVVTGRPLAEEVERFVNGVTAPPPGRGPARWNDRSGICVGVVNLTPALAQAIADRVSYVADSMGVPTGAPGCSPNVTLVATDDAGALASEMIRRSPNAFRPRYSGAAHSEDALRRFQADARPVRWWHVTMPVHADTGQAAVRLPGDSQPRYVKSPGGLRTSIRNELVRAHIILDITQTQGLTSLQIADYIAMVALAQINPDASASGFDSILNVFEDPMQVAEMTAWDRAYLHGLYGAELSASNVGAQQSAVSRSMLRTRRQALSTTSGQEPSPPNH